MSASPIDESARVVATPSHSFEALLADLGLPVESSPPATAFSLFERDGALDLRPPGDATRPGIQARFPPDRGTAGGRANPLVRAFGKRIRMIFDLTAGLGADAYRLAAAGYPVRACERNPAVYAVLSTGWARACDTGAVPASLANRVELRRSDAASVIEEIEGVDVGVYLDPMYPPPRRSSALPKRELQILRQLLGEEDCAAPLVEAARQRAARVVVKRPHHAPPLVPGASFELESKLVRFDVYLNPAMMGAATP